MCIRDRQIERAIFSDERQPPCRVFRNAFERPLLKCFHQRVLNDVFGKVQMSRAEDARQRGDDLRRVMPKQMIYQVLHSPAPALVTIISTSRISIGPPYSRCGQSPATSTARS